MVKHGNACKLIRVYVLSIYGALLLDSFLLFIWVGQCSVVAKTKKVLKKVAPRAIGRFYATTFVPFDVRHATVV